VAILDAIKTAHEVQVPWFLAHKGRSSSSLAFVILPDILSINAASFWICSADMATILVQSPPAKRTAVSNKWKEEKIVFGQVSVQRVEASGKREPESIMETV